MKRWSLSQRLFVRVKVLDASISHLPFTGHLSDPCLLPAYVSHRATLSIAVIVWAPASCSKTSAVRVPIIRDRPDQKTSAGDQSGFIHHRRGGKISQRRSDCLV